MKITDLDEYKNLRKELIRLSKINVNFLIVTFVGYSVSYYLKKILEDKKLNIAYIYERNQNLTKYNILDLDFYSNPDALKIVEEYLKSANLNQKFAVVINTPQILDSEDFKKTYIGTHFYSIYKFKKPRFDTIKVYARDMKVKLDETESKTTYSLTGGIGRLGKYILTNKDLIKLSPNELIENENIVKLIKPIVEVYSKNTKSLKEEFGVIEVGKYSSALIDAYLAKNPMGSNLEVEVSQDLFLIENGKTQSKLNGVEAKIVRFLILNNYLIEKEKIADIKWGEGSYDKYSDQAIVKTIRRLNKKFVNYKMKTISKVGYKLIEK